MNKQAKEKKSEAFTATLEGHEKPVIAVVALPDKRLASCCVKFIKIWDITPGREQCMVTLNLEHNDMDTLVLLPDGWLMGGSRRDDILKLWDITPGREQCMATLNILDLAFGSMEGVLPDGRVVTSLNNSIKLWEITRKMTPTLKCVATLNGHNKMISTVAVLSDRRLASGSLDNTVKLWDITSEGGRCVATLEGHTNMVEKLMKLPNGNFLSADFDNTTIKIWDIQGKCVTTLPMKEHVYAVKGLPGERIVINFGGPTIEIWDVMRKQCVTTWEEEAYVSTLAVFDGILVIGLQNGKIKLWNPCAPGLQLASSVPHAPRGFSQEGSYSSLFRAPPTCNVSGSSSQAHLPTYSGT